MHRTKPAIVFAVLVIGAMIAPSASGQSLADAAKRAEEAHAAATKKAIDESKPSDKSTDDKKKAEDAASEKKPAKTYSNKDLKDSSPSQVQTSGTGIAADVLTAPDATTSSEPSSLAANRIAAAALLEKRLVALSAAMAERDQTAARYQDACAGKATSAGWLLKGQLIMTPNAETPACRAMASDLARQRSAYDTEHAAIEETARVSRILPGVLRDILAAHNIPE